MVSSDDLKSKDEPIIAKADEQDEEKEHNQIELYDEHYSSGKGTPQQIILHEKTGEDNASPRTLKVMTKNASSPLITARADYDRA